MKFIRSRTGLVLVLALGLVMAAGIAAAQEGEQLIEEDSGPPSFVEGEFPPGNPSELPQLGTDEGESEPPPFLAYPDWQRGTPGPPPWAGRDGDGDGDGPPPFLAYPDWQRGTPGPPPWAGLEDGDPPPMLAYPDWRPGTPGPPPWAGADDDS